MQVVDHEQRRLLRGDVRDQPVEAVLDREGRVRRPFRGYLVDLEQRLRQGCRPVEELVARLRGQGREQRLEELPDDAVGELDLELPSSRCKHAKSPLRGDRASLAEEPRLADPGGALEHDEPAGALARGSGSRGELGQLGISFEQRDGGPRLGVDSHDRES